MGIAAVLDKAGPALATGIVLALLTGAASVVVAWRDLASTSSVRFGYVTAELGQIRAELDSFRAPGGRFTKHDGDRLQEQINRLDDRVRLQEMRPPRLNNDLADVAKRLDAVERQTDVLEERQRHIIAEQERLCQRLQACQGPRR